MNFLVINPPYVLSETRGQALPPNKAMLPVGPLAIASALLGKGSKVKFLDLAATNAATLEWQQKIRLEMADCAAAEHVLLCCHTARNIPACREIAALVREQLPAAHITVGGNLCADLGIKDFQQLGLEVSAVVRGYGHASSVINALEQKEVGDIFPDSVPDTLPVPALHLLDRVAHAWYRKKSDGRYPVVGPGGFGCRWSCGYCSAKMGSRFVPRRLENILAEAEMARMLGYTHLWCVDNVVLQDPEATLAFAQAVSKLGLTWSGMTRPETVVDLELLRQLKGLGLTEIAMGVETASADQLKQYKRGAGRKYFDQISAAFDLLRQAGIPSNAFVMLDGSGGTEADFWELYKLLKKIRPDTVSWSFFNPSPRVGLIQEGRSPLSYGFYRWPLGLSSCPPERVVQHAMILSGVWWKGWTLDEKRPFYGNRHGAGVRFKEGLLWQPRNSRSPVGDIWEVWEELPF